MGVCVRACVRARVRLQVVFSVNIAPSQIEINENCFLLSHRSLKRLGRGTSGSRATPACIESGSKAMTSFKEIIDLVVVNSVRS